MPELRRGLGDAIAVIYRSVCRGTILSSTRTSCTQSLSRLGHHAKVLQDVIRQKTSGAVVDDCLRAKEGRREEI